MGNDRQLHLGAAWENRGLFSRHYLETHLAAQPYWACDERAAALLDRVVRLYGDEYAPVRQEGNEEDTRNGWLDPLLRALGWEYHREPRIQRRRPDYVLYLSRDDKQRSARDRALRLSHAATILEAKYWGRPLNNLVPQDALDSTDATARFLEYLTQLDVRTDGRCQWAILTNGRLWRLFYSRAKGRATSYYEVDLLELIHRRDVEQFKYFLCFFEPAAFARDPRTHATRLDELMAESQRYAERVSESLKESIFDADRGVFIQLARGFVEHRRQEAGADAGEPDLDEIHSGTLTLLYRLLFLLYAESRDLLPVRDEAGYGHQSLMRQARRCAEIVDGRYRPPTRSTDIWSDLRTLFDVIRRGDPNLDVPLYNGGLFEPKPDAQGRDFFATHAVPDSRLAAAIDSLTRTPGETGERVWIDYSSLDVQQLGSIYEGLLEFRLRVAREPMTVVSREGREEWAPARTVAASARQTAVETGEIYLTNDKGERKSSGSYFTPHFLVQEIVHRTVAPVFKARKREAIRLLEELRRVRRCHDRARSARAVAAYQRRISQLEERLFDTLFGIRVLDPAMGSGHFLVETVDYLADAIAEFLSSAQVTHLLDPRNHAGAREVNPVLRRLENQRRDILEGLAEQGLRLTPDKRAAIEAKLSNNNLIRRMVLKRCIYGVDLNPAAVELAKVSLWLHCFTLGAPLSFLDHHLRSGNSLVGVTVDEVRQDLREDLFGSRLAGLLRATELMCTVGRLSDSTFAEVRQSFEAYRRASDELAPFKAMLDMWTAQMVGVDAARALLRQGMTYLDLCASSQQAGQLHESEEAILTAARQATDQHRFFHWELEFPEVWYQGGSRREAPGFDVVIGNPPWERIKLQEREFFRHRAPQIGAAVSAATRRRLIEELKTRDPALHAEYEARAAHAEAVSRFLRRCGQYPLAARGDMNTYVLFLERACAKVNRTGRIGLLVPSGIASDQTTAPFFNRLMDERRLTALYDFENRLAYSLTSIAPSSSRSSCSVARISEQRPPISSSSRMSWRTCRTRSGTWRSPRPIRPS